MNEKPVWKNCFEESSFKECKCIKSESFGGILRLSGTKNERRWTITTVAARAMSTTKVHYIF